MNSSRSATAAVPDAPALAPGAAKERDENPRVKPGLVNWHGSAAEARIAAEKSGRPVLVFHMMG